MQMALNVDTTKLSTIKWKTEKPSKERCRKSSTFSIMGEEWYLTMEFHVERRRANDSYGDRYIIFLMQNENKCPKSSFSVTTYVESGFDFGYNFTPPCCKIIIDSPYRCIWSHDVQSISEKVPGLEELGVFNVVCTFQPTCHVKSETIEVTTQTDFDRPLPVKNPYDLKFPSDANLHSLSVDFCKLLEDKVIPDINLRCGDRTVAAHKAILAARSPVFSAMFQSKMLENETGVIDIPDVDADVLEMFLKYVYSGRLSDMSDEGLPSLYAAGDKYDVSALKKVCSERMISNLSPENCLDVLLLADAHSDPVFKSAIFDFILNRMEILKSEEWKKLCKDNSALSTEVLQLIVERKCF